MTESACFHWEKTIASRAVKYFLRSYRYHLPIDSAELIGVVGCVNIRMAIVPVVLYSTGTNSSYMADMFVMVKYLFFSDVVFVTTLRNIIIFVSEMTVDVVLLSALLYSHRLHDDFVVTDSSTWFV
jgi:hypothetical protein